MSTLVIVRHGQSEWNKANKFTGWVDVDLAERGIQEAEQAGEQLKDYRFDVAFTSGLKRAQRTLNIILQKSEQPDVPVTAHEALNERMYGDLQGMDKDEARAQFGEEQVHVWRRSFDIAPPGGESLKDTADRVIPYFEENIAPALREGKTVIISAHGNSLRALIMHLEGLSQEEILKVEVATGKPKIYKLDDDLRVLKTDHAEA
ncbi:MAG: 2,3-diphosphoglycerate-dependent phosphoglycerate mutase [Cryomorphaceae bacterium]|nr:MAG: 2,3-diphosphoglycerate-dependent phosphoglycerate mutase [Cryomorphaceae bacterium]